MANVEDRVAKDKERHEKTVESESNPARTWLIRVGVVTLAFLLGFIPMLFWNLQLSADLAARDKQLHRNRIQNSLTAATIYSRRGEYETARQNTSTFFTAVRSEIDKGNAGVLSEQERIGLNNVMAERDEIITLLSRNDPASSERLSNAFVEYAGVVK